MDKNIAFSIIKRIIVGQNIIIDRFEAVYKALGYEEAAPSDELLNDIEITLDIIDLILNLFKVDKAVFDSDSLTEIKFGVIDLEEQGIDSMDKLLCYLDADYMNSTFSKEDKSNEKATELGN